MADSPVRGVLILMTTDSSPFLFDLVKVMVTLSFGFSFETNMFATHKQGVVPDVILFNRHICDVHGLGVATKMCLATTLRSGIGWDEYLSIDVPIMLAIGLQDNLLGFAQPAIVADEPIGNGLL